MDSGNNEERPLTYSRRSSRLPPLPAEAGERVQAVFQKYGELLGELRGGKLEATGPFYCGDLLRAEAETLLENVEGRAVLMLLPTMQPEGWVTVWLCGDTTVVHDMLASRIGNLLHNQMWPLGYQDPSGVVNNFTGDLPVNLRWAGEMKSRSFQTGSMSKNPDAMFGHPGEPNRWECTLAVEVAYRNEDIGGLLFEALTWTQQGLDLPGKVQRAVNFLGIKVCHDTHMADPARPAWAVVKSSRADPQTGFGKTEVFLFNSSAQWMETWQRELDASRLPSTTLCMADEAGVDVELSFFSPKLPDTAFVRLDEGTLNEVFTQGTRCERVWTQNPPKPQPEGTVGDDEMEHTGVHDDEWALQPQPQPQPQPEEHGTSLRRSQRHESRSSN